MGFAFIIITVINIIIEFYTLPFTHNLMLNQLETQIGEDAAETNFRDDKTISIYWFSIFTDILFNKIAYRIHVFIFLCHNPQCTKFTI